MSIEPCNDLRTFFARAVGDALDHQHVVVRTATREYLSQLLAQVAHGPGAEVLARPIALLLDDALSGPTPGERVLGLQTVGDGALCVAGLFPGQLERARLDPDYYITIGAYAYREAAQLVGPVDPREPNVLAELGERFPVLVDVLGEVAEATALGAVAKSVVQLYDQWKRGNGARALGGLASRGAFPVLGGEGRKGSGGGAC